MVTMNDDIVTASEFAASTQNGAAILPGNLADGVCQVPNSSLALRGGVRVRLGRRWRLLPTRC